PKGTLPNDEVFMTIIKTNKLAARGTVEEKDRLLLKEGDAVKIVPTAHADARISGSVLSIAPAPLGGSYEVRFQLKEVPEGVQPGHTGTARIKAYFKENALLVAASAVDYDDDADSYVAYVPGKNGGPATKVPVKIGRRSGDKIEVLEGLAEGTEVLKEKPAK
ncbi:MAG TPA: HlyD family efflux transporter periplasmic adaptor subunit, partial [Gemmatales bacterium]|nr:HlyD family efflux transporter periplasmic adaptor subunit [Gemmatales bacterium]